MIQCHVNYEELTWIFGGNHIVFSFMTFPQRVELLAPFLIMTICMFTIYLYLVCSFPRRSVSGSSLSSSQAHDEESRIAMPCQNVVRGAPNIFHEEIGGFIRDLKLC